MMKNMFVLFIFFDGFCFFWMCVVVDCDDLAMNGVFRWRISIDMLLFL